MASPNECLEETPAGEVPPPVEVSEGTGVPAVETGITRGDIKDLFPESSPEWA